MAEKPDSIKKTRLLLAEGIDGKLFLDWACGKCGRANDIQVLDFGGVGSRDLPRFLAVLANDRHWPKVEALVVCRDAETDAYAAIKSVKHHLRAAGLPVPDDPYKFVDGHPRVAFMILPGADFTTDGASVYRAGTLEDLCLDTVAGDPLMQCVERYMECAADIEGNVRRPHKSRLYAYLAGKTEMAGMKLAQAARANAWDWNHPALDQLRLVITGT